MADEVKLRLDLVDVYGKRLGESVDLDFRHQTLSEHKVVRGVSASKRIVVSDLRGAPQGLYRVEIDPPAYLPVGQFVNLKASGFTGETVVFPIDPKCDPSGPARRPRVPLRRKAYVGSHAGWPRRAKNKALGMEGRHPSWFSCLPPSPRHPTA